MFVFSLGISILIIIGSSFFYISFMSVLYWICGKVDCDMMIFLMSSSVSSGEYYGSSKILNSIFSSMIILYFVMNSKVNFIFENLMLKFFMSFFFVFVSLKGLWFVLVSIMIVVGMMSVNVIISLKW